MRRSSLKHNVIMNALVILTLFTCLQTVTPGVVEAPDDTQAQNATWGNGSADSDRSVEDKIKELRIETVKQQILSGLNLKEPPQTVTGTSDVSKEAVKLLLQQENEEQQQNLYHPLDTVKRLIIPEKGDELECLLTNSSNCKMFQYEFGTVLNMSMIDLWVYKLGDIPRGLSVSLTLSSAFQEKYYDSFYFELQTRGWNRFRLLPSLLLPSSWNDTVQSSVEIIGRDVDHYGAHRPYLMASKSLFMPSRHRRDTECDTNESCCKKPLRLSFAEIGYNFIVYPEALEANMCVGKCRLDHSTMRTHYERALTNAIEKNITLRETLGECWTLCCKPKELKEVRVIYKDLDNLHHDQFIPELSVESCSCS